MTILDVDSHPCSNFTDRDYNDGIDRTTFESAVRHVVEGRFWWPKSLSDLLIYEYTDWKKRDDYVANRQGYKEVSTK